MNRSRVRFKLAKSLAILLSLPFLAGAGLHPAIALTSQTVSFTSSAPSYPVVGDTYTVTGSASSGLTPVASIDTSTSTICSISGSTVTFNKSGNCVVNLTQAGNSTYDSATAQQTILVVDYKFNCTSSSPYGQPGDPRDTRTINVAYGETIRVRTINCNFPDGTSGAITSDPANAITPGTSVSAGAVYTITGNATLSNYIAGVNGLNYTFVYPSAPAAPTITSITGNAASANINFTAGSDNGASISNYQYSTDNGSSWSTPNPAITTSPITITGLTAGTTYNIKLRAVNVVGPGTASSASSFTPTAATSVGATGNTINVIAGSTTNLNSVLANPMVVTGFDASLTLLATLTTTLGTLQETSTAVSAVTGYQSPVTNAAASIAFSGTQAQLNEALASVTLIAGATSGAATITVSISNRGTNSIAYNPDNQHYYQYVSTSKKWSEAYNMITGDTITTANTVARVAFRQSQTAANCAYSFNGMCGYYATVSSLAENDFIKSKVGGAQVWLGGSDRRYEGVWKWEDPKAPEYDLQFSNQSSSYLGRVDQTGVSHAGTGSSGTGQAQSYTVGGTTYSFVNWNNNEPNNSGQNENALQILAGASADGKWNDLREDDQSMGFIVEYGGLNETLTYPTATRTITANVKPAAPTFDAVTSTSGGFTVQISNFSNTSTYDTTTVTAGSATISGTGLITVTGLASLQSSSVTVRVTAGGQSSTATVTGTSLVSSSPCPKTYCVLDNGYLHFGNGGHNSTSYTIFESSINSSGLFQQPHYHSADGKWYKLTYSNYPLDLAIGSGSGGTNWTGNTVEEFSSTTLTSATFDYSQFTITDSSTAWAKGYGKVTVSGDLGTKYKATHVYELGQNDNFVKITTTIKNISAGTLNNVNIFVGTRDDWVGNTDRPVKTRGNLDGPDGAFQAITNQTQQAKAIQITTANEGALFYSSTAGANTAYNSCCSFSNAYNQNPNTSGIQSAAMDGSYTAIYNFGNLAVNASGEIVWFYAAGAIADLAVVSQSVAAAARPPAPSKPTAVAGDGSVSLTWTAPSSTTSPIYNYQIQYSTDTGTTWSTLTRTASTSTSWNVSGLTNGQSYIFRVAAITSNDSGATTTTGDYGPSSDPVIPGTPGVSSAVTTPVPVDASGNATVSFTAPSTPTTAITYYQYRLPAGGGTWGPWETATATSSPITIPNLEAGNLFSVQMRALNSYGAGQIWSAFNILTYPDFNDNALPSFVVGTAVNVTNILAAASITPGSYAISAGALPAGLSLDANTGAITGTPTTAGAYNFTISATNAQGTGSRTFTGTVFTTPVVVSTTLPGLTTGSAANITAPITGGTTYSITSGALPAGLTLNSSTGAITGTPTTTGAYTFNLRAVNAAGTTNQLYSGTVNAPASGGGAPLVVWNTPQLTPIVQSNATSIALNTSNATIYSILTGSLPPGMTLNPNTGVISGTPTTPGTYTFQILANNPSNTGQAQNFTLIVQPAPTSNTDNSGTGTSGTGTGSSGSGGSGTNGNNSGTGTGTGSGANGNNSGTGTGTGSGTGTSGDTKLPDLNPVKPDSTINSGSSLVLQDGKPVSVTLKPNSSGNGLILTGPDFTLTLAAVDASGKAIPLSGKNSLIVQQNQFLRTQGTGFLPNSLIKVFVFSDPTLVGTLNTDAKGAFSGVVPIPGTISEGDHILQIVGYSADKKVRNASIPLLVVKANAAPVVKPQSAGVITFTKGSFVITSQAKSVIKQLDLSKTKSVVVYGYASNSKITDDLRISLDRAIEVRKQLQKLYPKLQVTVLGQGTRKVAACKAYNNLCAVVVVKK